jgi:hypothetical protein
VPQSGEGRKKMSTPESNWESALTQWEQSKWFPCPKNGTPLLLLTENNTARLLDELRGKQPSITAIVEAVNRLTQQGKLQYDQPRVIERVVEKTVAVKPVEEPLPPVPAKFPKLETNADIRALSSTRFSALYRGPDAEAFKKRIEEVKRRGK